MDIQYGNPNNIWLMAVVAVGMLVTVYAVFARRRAGLRFATTRLRNQVIPPGTASRHSISAILIASSMTLLCLALIDIRWDKTWREVPQKGIEVMFVLDVSRSMLAEDATPNRLSRAKQQIKDMIDEMAGDRIGLVVFAGETRQSVPLTSHYEDFRQTLDSVGPHSVQRGGSRLGDALSAAANGFISKTSDHKTIVVFTDGEDQESDPLQVAKRLHADQGIRIFTVGLGDMDQGARIPETEDRRGGFVQHAGQQVWSKMNGQILSQIATDTEGAYIPAGTQRVNMADVYHRFVANVEQSEFETARINIYVARYQWFAAPALLLLVLEVWISTRHRTVRRATEKQSIERSKSTIVSSKAFAPGVVSVAFASIACLSSTAAAQAPQNADSAARQINAANTLLRDGRIDEALDAYHQVSPSRQERDRLNYNLAVAEYRKGNIAAAESLFREVAGTDASEIAADSRYNLGNCQYAKALQVAQQDPAAAIALLRHAISDYRGALRRNPNNSDARANIELAGELIRQLEQEQKQQEEQNKPNPDQPEKDDEKQGDQKKDGEQDKSQQSESQQDDSQKNGEQKQDPANDNASNSDQPKNGDQNPDKDQSESEQQASSDQQPESQPRDSSSKQTQPKNNPQQTSKEQQSDGDEKSDEHDKKDEPVPDGDLKAAGQQENSSKPADSASMGKAELQDGLMTREEALKMLQSVRDRDMLRRMQQQRRERSRHIPVERDW